LVDRALAKIGDRIEVQKTEARRASGKAEQKGSGDLTFKIKNDAFEISFVEDLLAFSGTEEEGTTTEVIDLASDTLGVVVDASEEAVTKDLTLVTGNAQMVLDVASGLFEVKGFEVEADGNALVESLVRCKAELVGQVGLAE
jgi:hypothetical protein